MIGFEKTQKQNNAVLLSPEIEMIGKFCLQFSFRVYKSLGSLSIKIRVRIFKSIEKSNKISIII